MHAITNLTTHRTFALYIIIEDPRLSRAALLHLCIPHEICIAQIQPHSLLQHTWLHQCLAAKQCKDITRTNDRRHLHVGSTCSLYTSPLCKLQRQNTCALAGGDLRLPARLGLLALLPRHIKPIQLLLGAALSSACIR